MKIINLILPFLLFTCNLKQGPNVTVFKKEIGPDLVHLDRFIKAMEDKLEEVYKKKSIEANYQYFLIDLQNGKENPLRLNYADCELFIEYCKTNLSHQYEYLPYDTVYFDTAIVTEIQNDENEILEYKRERKPPKLIDSIEVDKRMNFLRERGYNHLKLQSILGLTLSNNIFEDEFITTFNKRGYLPMGTPMKHLANTALNLRPDYSSYIVKSLIFFDFYIRQFYQNELCSTFYESFELETSKTQKLTQ